MHNNFYFRQPTLLESSKEMGRQFGTISNLDKLLNKSLEKLAKLSRVWVSSDLENKRRIQKTLFPDGIYYGVKNHYYVFGKFLQKAFLAIFKDYITARDESSIGESFGCGGIRTII